MRFTVFTISALLLMWIYLSAGEEPHKPAVKPAARDSLSAVSANSSKTFSDSNQSLDNLKPTTVRFARNEMPPAESPANTREEESNPARETVKNDRTVKQTIQYLGGLPGEYKLHPAFPDPVTSAIPLRFDIPNSSGPEIAVELSIYNTLGEKINTLFEGELGAGRYEIQWQENAEGGDQVGPGVYYALFKTEFFQQVRKVTLTE
jgi:hypothetical protein